MFMAMAGPSFKDEEVPYFSCRLTLGAPVVSHWMGTVCPAWKVPLKGAVMARGPFCWAATRAESVEAVAERMVKKRMMID